MKMTVTIDRIKFVTLESIRDLEIHTTKFRWIVGLILIFGYSYRKLLIFGVES